MGVERVSEMGIESVLKIGVESVSETKKIFLKTQNIFAISDILLNPNPGRQNRENLVTKTGIILIQIWG